jgi:hypothetical protein
VSLAAARGQGPEEVTYVGWRDLKPGSKIDCFGKEVPHPGC